MILAQLWQWPTCLCRTLATIHAKYYIHDDNNDVYSNYDYDEYDDYEDCDDYDACDDYDDCDDHDNQNIHDNHDDVCVELW